MKRIKFQNTLFILFSGFIGMILIVSGIVFYTYTVSQMKLTASDNQMKTTIKVQEQISSVLDEMDRIAIAVNASGTILKTLKGIPEDKEKNYFDYHPQETGQIKNIFYSIMSLKNFRARIKLVSRYYDYMGISTQYDRTIKKSDISSDGHYLEMMQSDKYKFFIPPHNDIWTSYNSNVMSVLRPIRDNYGGVFGFVEMNLPVLELDKMVEDVNIVILNGEHKIAYSNADLSADQKASIELGEYKNDDGFSVDQNNGGLIISYSLMKNSGWRIVQFADRDAFYNPVRSIGRIILITYVLVFVVTLLLLYLFIRFVTKPIRKLTDIVLEADAKDPNLHLNTSEMKGEMIMLANSVQELVHTVYESSNQLIELKTREMKTQIMALEAQLNPHFIYNTLSVIGAYGIKANNEVVYEMCLDLSEMLRYTVDFNLKNATIQSEINHVKTYLSLMKKRYDHLFTFSIVNEIKDETITVPKLMIQPIVENCFLHGFVHAQTPWHIHIHLFIVGQEWRVSVEDNGSGFEKSAIESIYESLNEENLLQKKSGIGMVNTFIRLRHYFEGREHVKFFSEKGAIVEIGGPINYERN